MDRKAILRALRQLEGELVEIAVGRYAGELPTWEDSHLQRVVRGDKRCPISPITGCAGRRQPHVDGRDVAGARAARAPNDEREAPPGRSCQSWRRLQIPQAVHLTSNTERMFACSSRPAHPTGPPVPSTSAAVRPVASSTAQGWPRLDPLTRTSARPNSLLYSSTACEHSGHHASAR